MEFIVFGRKQADEDTHDTFVKNLRSKIEDSTCATSTGICVFEHEDDSALDDKEKAVLERLRTAHEAWQSENKPENEDAYASVRVKV